MKLSGIYKITNLVNGVVYIGQSVDLKGRLKCLRRNAYLNNALEKYGEENFDCEVLEFTDNLNEREQFYIDLYDATNRSKGYNLRGAGSQGHWSQEVKDKIRDSQLGLKVYNNGEKSIKAKECPEGFVSGYKDSRNHWNIGSIRRERTLEEKLKMSVIMKSRMVQPETREKSRKSAIKRFESVSERVKVSEQTKKLWEDPEYRKKNSEAHKGKIWWTDGKNEIMIEDSPGEGWVRGRLPGEGGKVWWTDGINEVKAKKRPGVGWRRSYGKRRT